MMGRPSPRAKGRQARARDPDAQSRESGFGHERPAEPGQPPRRRSGTSQGSTQHGEAQQQVAHEDRGSEKEESRQPGSEPGASILRLLDSHDLGNRVGNQLFGRGRRSDRRGGRPFGRLGVLDSRELSLDLPLLVSQRGQGRSRIQLVRRCRRGGKRAIGFLGGGTESRHGHKRQRDPDQAGDEGQFAEGFAVNDLTRAEDGQ